MSHKGNAHSHKSVVLFALRTFGNKIRSIIADSAIGTLFSSYDSATEAFERGVVYTSLKRATKSQSVTKLRRLSSAMFDNSFVRRMTLMLTRAMRHCTMRFYGVLMLSFSLYVILTYLIRKYGMFYTAPISHIIISIAVAVLSIPLICEKNRPLGEVLLDSKFFSWLLFDCFELRYENFRVADPPIKRVSIAFILGMALGCCTFFVSPLTILLFLGFLIYLYFSLVSPESSFLMCLFFVPFLSVFEHPTIILCALVLCILAGYFIKLVRHKRVFRFGILEGMVLLFMLMVLFGGMRNASMTVSVRMPVMLLLMSGLFISANLLRTKSMILHAQRAISLSCVMCAVIGILEYLLGMATLDWIDVDMFSGISGRAVSFFENPNVLANYLCLGAPLTLSLVSMAEEKSKSRWFFGFVFIIICSVFTWSRGAWIGIAAALVVMLVCMRHTFVVVGGGALLIVFSQYILPASVLDRIGSIGDTADSSTMYRLNIWRGCADMASEYGFEGIGVGEEAFLRIYPKFAVAGAETAYHAHSLLLQILLMLGICGLVIFIVMMFFFYQRSITVARNTSDRSLACIVYGAMSGISGLLVSGLFDYTWYNYRVVFAYFVVMGFVCACTETARAETKGGSHGYDW